MKRRFSTRPQPDLTFFVDRNLGRGVVELLRRAGIRAEAHDDHFPQNTLDTVWIPQVVKRGWIVLTNDKRIGSDTLEIEALMTAGGRAIVPKGVILPKDFAALIIRSKLQVERFIRKHAKFAKVKPYMAKLGRNPTDPTGPGVIEMWIDESKWLQRVARS